VANNIIKSFSEKYSTNGKEVEKLWEDLEKEYGTNYSVIVDSLENILKKHKATDSDRELTPFKHLKIDNCILTAESVDPYMGSELSVDGLDNNKIYNVYRPAVEIEKSLNSYNNVPLTNDHYFVDDIKTNKDKWIGTVGTNAEFKDGKLYNSVAVWDVEAVELVKAKKEGLSSGYSYKLIKEQGTWNGKPYDFKMCDLVCNHVALVDNARVKVAKLADSSIVVKEFNRMDADKLLRRLQDTHPRIVADAEEELKKEKELKDTTRVEATGKGTSTDETEVEIKKEFKDKKKGKDKKAKDKKKGKDMSEEACDEEEEEKEEEVKITKDSINELVRQQLSAYNEAKSLCEKVIGRANFASDATPESMIDATLKAKNIDFNGYSMETKQALLKHLVSDSKKEKSIPLFISDSADSLQIINL